MTQPETPATRKTSLDPTPIKGINTVGLVTLIQREVSRFMSVYMQTLIAPVVTTLLFYAIFALAFGGNARDIHGINFMQFLIPGLIMMTMAQNAFANTSSSIMISKVQGNIVDLLMPPLSDSELYTGFVLGGIIRGLLVGFAACIGVRLFVPYTMFSVFHVMVFAVLGTMMLSSLGILAGLWSERFDHMAAFTNFVITPLTFLSGTFYSVKALPSVWRLIADFNPFFYMIDGFRYGFIGQSDSVISTGIGVLLGINILMGVMILFLLRTGYKIKS